MIAAPRIHPSLCQIAITTMDVERSILFYGTLLGFRHAGYIPVQGRVASRLLEVPHVHGECHWLSGDASFFQLELFRFDEPVPHKLADHPYDYGYDRIAVAVGDLDHMLNAAIRSGAQLVRGVTAFCDAERACIRDPDGVVIELIAAKNVGAKGQVVGVAATVGDLEEARRYYLNGFGLKEREPAGPERETMWRPDTASRGASRARDTIVLAAGQYWLEVTQYQPNPLGAFCRCHRLTDQGLMNIALGVRKAADFNLLYRNVLEQGHRSATDPLGGRLSHSVYIQHADGLSVELLQLPRIFDSLWGFQHPGRIASACQRAIRFGLRRQRLPTPYGSQT